MATKEGEGMSIETLDDIVSEITDQIGRYGACQSQGENCSSHQSCRACFESSLKSRLLDALEVHQLMQEKAASVYFTPKPTDVDDD